MQIEQLKSIVEAALLASTQPMTVQQLGDLFSEADEVTREQIARALESLGEDCSARGIELKEVASGFRYQVRQDVHPWISRMWTERPSRYSRALLETLALIAYRQPITRPEIEQIRGVVVSSNIIKTMEEREWIRVVGYRDVPGKPALFGTTRAFLDYFNLKSLDQLPPLSEIRDMEDPQLRFEPDPLPARIVRDLPIDPEDNDRPEQELQRDEYVDQAVANAEIEQNDNDQASASALMAGAEDRYLATDAEATVVSYSDDGGSLGSPTAETLTTTADEAANPAANVETDTASQDPEEYRA